RIRQKPELGKLKPDPIRYIHSEGVTKEGGPFLMPGRITEHRPLAHPNQRQHVPAHRARATTTPTNRRTVDDSHHRTGVHSEQLNIPRRTHSQREMHSLQPRAHTRRSRRTTHHRRIPSPLRNRQELLDRRGRQVDTPTTRGITTWLPPTSTGCGTTRTGTRHAQSERRSEERRVGQER